MQYLFILQCPVIIPTLWGHADGLDPALSSTQYNSKFLCSIYICSVTTPALPLHCGDNQKVIAPHLSTAISPLPIGGGQCLQMTGRLHLQPFIEPIQSCRWGKNETAPRKTLDHPQAELGFLTCSLRLSIHRKTPKYSNTRKIYCNNPKI